MTTGLDISREHLECLLALLDRFVPEVAVWAYGSRVKNAARPNSDLDLVVFSSPQQRPRVFELKDALDESNIPFRVDLHIWDEVPERFHEIIRNEHRVLKSGDVSREFT